VSHDRWNDPNFAWKDFGVGLDDDPETIAAKIYHDPHYHTSRYGLENMDKRALEGSPWHDAFIRDFAGVVPLAGKKILDAGGGPGAFCRVFRQAGADPYLIDISTFAVGVAKQLLSDDHAVRGSVHDLSAFADGTFDMYFCSEMPEHVPFRYHYPLFSEMRRVLKPGAFVYFQGDMRVADYSVEHYHDDPGHVAMFPMGYWADFFAHFGFVLKDGELERIRAALERTPIFEEYRWTYHLAYRGR